MHSVKFLKGPSLTVLTNNFIKETMKFFLNTWAIRVHKYGFVLLNRLGIVNNTVFSNPRTAKYWKWAKIGFTQNIFANTLLHTYTQLIVRKTKFQSPALLTKERILFLSSLTPVSITSWPIALCHLTQRQKMRWFLASWCQEHFNDT